jgi:hypothetical protein
MKYSRRHFFVNHFLVVAVLLACGIAMQGQTTKKKNAPPDKEHLIDIITYRTDLLKTPDPKPSQHKHHDVLVYKAEAGGIYGIAYFLTEDDTLRRGWWGLVLKDEEYDIAHYRWTNDTTFVLRIGNSATKKEKPYSISGTTKQSRMKVLKAH